MMPLTDTQKEYLELLKEYGYIIVIEGATYATFVIHKKQMHSSSFEALKKHGLINQIDNYKSPKGLVCSVWKFSDSQ